jgi:hypothetical protein
MLHSPETAIVLAAAKWACRPTVSLKAVAVLFSLGLLAGVIIAAAAAGAGRQARLDEAAIAAGRTADARVAEKRLIGGGIFGDTYRLSLRDWDRDGTARTAAVDVDPATFARAATGGSLRIAFPDDRGGRIIVADAAYAAGRVRDMANLAFAAALGAMFAGAGLLAMWWRAAR